ncbi:hypothetical protein [Scytonema sp. PCC 10023]|uniref:hypothetical protein n=1 Tax=Scytonema sp. PCC 10023 TaxID=1680591 RepID=UPI0039C6BAC0
MNATWYQGLDSAKPFLLPTDTRSLCYTPQLLYLLMLIVPMSGILLSNTGGHDVPFFFVRLPN